ncbi:hypothetical protein [Roseibium sp.]|uniref:hypothetical protein n=1 Tax=Roseibium sp. TaxID=1936156 RepID=UPI00391C554A
MTPIVNRNLQPEQRPVHILIVVVGDYISFDYLKDADKFTDELTSFWRGPRQFEPPYALSTITVLASDIDGRVSVVDDRGRSREVELPTLDNCKKALLKWAERIKAENGLGVLHWVGHGRERAGNGGIVDLYVDGPRDEAPSSQQGIDWTRAIFRINQMTEGQPVYCFLDTCRRDDGSTIEFEGLGSFDTRFSQNAMVFQSTVRGAKAFWVNSPESALQKAGCQGQALGTRAFLAALNGLGARYAGSCVSTHPILAAEIVEGSSALAVRWLQHQGLPQGIGTTGPQEYRQNPILLTDKPQSVVDVVDLVPASASNCHAIAVGSSSKILSETPNVPFEFRLHRVEHDFCFEHNNNSGLKQIIYPKVSL